MQSSNNRFWGFLARALSVLVFVFSGLVLVIMFSPISKWGHKMIDVGDQPTKADVIVVVDDVTW